MWDKLRVLNNGYVVGVSDAVVFERTGAQTQAAEIHEAGTFTLVGAIVEAVETIAERSAAATPPLVAPV